jgi:bifunctional non-homologous end joining protein LigD
MAADRPDRYTTTLAKAARRGRIFVDYLRNDRTATAVASYSLRSRARAPIAMPLSWDEVTSKLDPLRFTILTVPEIVASRANPWAAMGQCRQRLRSDALERLAA